MLEQFGQDVLTKLHAQCKVDTKERIFTADHPAGCPTPPGFCAAKLGHVLREATEQLERLQQSPRQEFSWAFEQVELLLHDANMPEKDRGDLIKQLLVDVSNAGKVFAQFLDKWMTCLKELPMLVFELGGDSGKDLALAFLKHFANDIPHLSEEQKRNIEALCEDNAMVKTFVDGLHQSTIKHEGDHPIDVLEGVY